MVFLYVHILALRCLKCQQPTITFDLVGLSSLLKTHVESEPLSFGSVLVTVKNVAEFNWPDFRPKSAKVCYSMSVSLSFWSWPQGTHRRFARAE